ncbi:type II secretion system F family protein [Patescibacteria group bacterium]|nr:type II secretion system F family protein [Patescibacteria group bacterium]
MSNFKENMSSDSPLSKEIKDIDKYLESVNLDERGLEKDRIVYGVTDTSARSLWQKVDDYLVDQSKVPIDEKAYFFHLLAVMLDAGLPILKSLRVLAVRTSNRRFRRVINTLIYNVENGKRLSDSMSKFPEVFDESEIGIVRSGEAVGHLDQMLFKLSDQLEKDRALSQKISGTLWYPIVVLIVLVLVASIIIIFVIPTLKTLFEASGVELPFFTRMFIGISDVIGKLWWLFILIFIAIYTIFSTYIHSESGRFRWDYFKLTIPIVGDIIRRTIIARFVLLLSVLVESGLPINRSLHIVANSLGNDVYKRKVMAVKEKVEQGQRISDNLKDAPYLFPDTIVNMINIGEGSASLGQISYKLATHYMREVDSSIKKLTTVFEPIVILFVALFVALLAISVLLPLFSLGDVMVK